MRLRLSILALAALPWGCFAAEVLTIDSFEYADGAAAAAEWRAAEGSDPVQVMQRASQGGNTALKLPCVFTSDLQNERAVYDREVQLDLTRYGAITFDFHADAPEPVRGGTIYFHSQDGWYGSGFPIERGWNRIVLGKGAFGTEDRPAGWGAIDRIRICAWKAKAQDTFCAIDNLEARVEDIAVIRGPTTGPEGRSAQQISERVGEYLQSWGVPYGTLTDDDVAAGALEGHKLAVFAFSPQMSDATAEKVKDFSASGGKVIACYSIRPDVAELIGVSGLQYKGNAFQSEFHSIEMENGVLVGAPETVGQASWNVTVAQPAANNARVVGYWRDREGIRYDPAVIVSDTGAFIGHVLTGSDPEGQRSLLLALVGHFQQSAWQEAADSALTGAMRIGPFGDMAALKEFIEARTTGAPSAEEAAAELRKADEAEKSARGLLDEKRYPEFITQARVMRAALADAYTVAHELRDGEFRAVWNHSGTGDCGTWDDAMKRLADANFNAVVPNMWWGGVAHYDSKLLPHSSTFDQKGDQIAQCVEAGKRHGIEVHPWKVNWNLSTAPKEFVDRMRAEGRLQRQSNGEELEWLCPSHPDNQKLELDTMLEVVRSYDVDGVHFDYIRYPHGDSCYCDGCRERFETQLGRTVGDWPTDCSRGELKQQYRDWRCTNITKLVQATSEQARAIKPYVKISAAVFSNYPGCKNDVGQDWVLWCKNGWLDFVCPMNYTKSDTGLNSLVSSQLGHMGDSVPLYSGIGQFIIPDDQVIGQIEITRANGADGFILFNMGAALAETGLPKFARGVTSTKASLPHNAPVISFLPQTNGDAEMVHFPDGAAQVDVTTVSAGEHRSVVTSLTGHVELQDLDGKAIARLAELPAVGATVSVSFTVTPAPVRLAAVGELKFADGATRRFVRRSRPCVLKTGG